MFLRTRGMHFYQRCQKTLDKNSKAFRSISEINYINNQLSQKNTSWENVSNHIDCMFDSPAEKKIPKNRKSFLPEKNVGEK